MTRKELQERTKKFHVEVIKLYEQFPRNTAGFETARQLIRSAGSVGANYRASARAKSPDDFLYKIEIVLEESDESHYWLEVVKDASLVKGIELERLIKEANELTAIFAATDKTNKAKETVKINGFMFGSDQTSEILNHTSNLCIYKEETAY